MGNSGSEAKVEDRYYLQKVKLGQGSFGTVWRGIDRQTSEIVAIKQLDRAALPKRGVRPEDIEREVRVMEAVQHDCLTRLIGFYQDAYCIYLALEYCDGGDFGDKVKERGLALTEPEAADWVGQILSAIAALHSKEVCHRDIKPDNFMVHLERVRAEAPRNRLKLSDFGLALFLPPGRLLVDKCGTPAFMAPEQHLLPKQSRGYTHLCDCWAAGVTMFMLMLGGRHPFLSGKTNQLDEQKLLAGELNFAVSQGFFSIGSRDQRFSEEARGLCRRMVEPDLSRRACSAILQKDPWLTRMPRRYPISSTVSYRVASVAQYSVQTRADDPPIRLTSAPPPRAEVKVTVRQQESESSSGGQWWPFGAGSQSTAPTTDTPNASEAELQRSEARAQKEQGDSHPEMHDVSGKVAPPKEKSRNAEVSMCPVFVEHRRGGTAVQPPQLLVGV